MVLSILIPHPFPPELIVSVCDCSFPSSPPSQHWTVGTLRTLLFYWFILYLFYLASVTYGFNKYLWFQQLFNKYLWVTLNEWKQWDILNKYCLAFTKSLLIRDQVWSLGWEDPLEKEMETHSSILAWGISWTEEPGGLQSVGFQRVGHDWVTNTN